MTSFPFPSFPISQITIPSRPIIISAYTYVKENCSETTLNHCLRSVAFGLILQKKFLPFATNKDLDTDTIILSILLHDMGWATTKSLISKDRRFEVDGADIARDFITREGSGQWDKHRLQLVWDAIALHTTLSIAPHKEPEVFATHLGIMADLFGPNIPLPGHPITIDEYKEVVQAFPRLGFKEELREVFCGFCRDKPDTVIDNVVGEWGKIYGLDGKGGGKEEFLKMCEERNIVKRLDESFAFLEQYEN